jgi:hypothetical protein
MASRIRGDHFSDPFIVAELPNDTDALADVSVYSPTEDDMDKDKALVAVRTELVSKHDDSEGLPIYSAAHLWYTEVPAVRSATAVACEASVPFVCPGGSIDFHVAVRNDGNVFLSGCTLTMYLLDEETGSYASVKGASAKVTFDAHSLLESTYNKRGDDGTLDDIEPDHALCPGKTSVYAVTVTVPKDWKEGAQKSGLSVRVGRWKVPGKPIAVLVDFKAFLNRETLNNAYASAWEKFGVDSLHAYGDYDESAAFGIAS